MEAWGRDDFSVYKMHKGETVEIQVKKYVAKKNTFMPEKSAIWESWHFFISKAKINFYRLKQFKKNPE